MEMKKVTININDSTGQMLREGLPGVALSRACAVITEVASEWASEARDAVLEKFTEAELVKMILALKDARPSKSINSIMDIIPRFFASARGFILMPSERKRAGLLAKITRLKDQEKLALIGFCNGYWKGQYESIIDYVRDALKLAS